LKIFSPIEVKSFWIVSFNIKVILIKFNLSIFFFFLIIHMCIQGLGHFSPLPPPYFFLLLLGVKLYPRSWRFALIFFSKSFMVLALKFWTILSWFLWDKNLALFFHIGILVLYMWISSACLEHATSWVQFPGPNWMNEWINE
jgi:hypothetical protein